jgi:antirestriction protein ArdC
MLISSPIIYAMSNSRISVAEVIAQRFVEELNKGVAPWARGFQTNAPRNAVTNREYRGVNYFLLSMLGVDAACTYNQAKQLGGNVKKGAKGIPVVLWKPLEKKDAATGDVEKRGMMMRYFTVFATRDIEGVAWKTAASVTNPDSRDASAESLFAQIQKVCGFTLLNGGNQPCFIPALNRVEMPEFDRWNQAGRFYKTLFHECGHALGKVTGKVFSHAKESYATEELVAELFASVCLNRLGMNSAECWDNSVAYVQSWAGRLGNDPQMIISAAQEVQKRLDLFLPKQESAASVEID